MSSRWLVFAFLILSAAAAHAATPPSRYPLIAYWSHNLTRYPDFPVPGSFDRAGRLQENLAFRAELNDINVLAYAFLKADASGSVYFSRPAIDLGAADRQDFCSKYPRSCPNSRLAAEASFRAFSQLQNRRGTLQKIISVGGANSQRTLDNALDHPKAFVQSVAALVTTYHLNGVDLDFEPNSFFFGDQGQQFVTLARALRSALGPEAFISIELPTDWETLRSVDCRNLKTCDHHLAALATVAYLSLMGYAVHLPSYPGPAVTANDSNLFSDPNEPLLAGFDHVSDDQAVDYLTFVGVPADRILLGFPAFTATYQGVMHPGAHFGLYQPFDRSPRALRSAFGAYRDVPRLVKSGFVLHYVNINHAISAAYAYNATSATWMSLDDPDSVAAKAQYVTSHGLGGLMMWEIGQDVPPGNPWSLLDAAHRGLQQVGQH